MATRLIITAIPIMPRMIHVVDPPPGRLAP
jgi:hypothetical protein